MGGCVSRPKELDGPKSKSILDDNNPSEVEVATSPVEDDVNAPALEADAKIETDAEAKEEPLIDLSEPKPEAAKSESMVLAMEISELQVDEQETTTVTKEDAPVVEHAAIVEKDEHAKESDGVVDGMKSDEKVSA